MEKGCSYLVPGFLVYLFRDACIADLRIIRGALQCRICSLYDYSMQGAQRGCSDQCGFF